MECLNRTLAERLFGHQYAVEILLPSGQRSTAWLKRLPDVVAALKNEVTCLTSKKPAVPIKAKVVSAKPSTPYSRPVDVNEDKIPPIVNVCYLYEPSELGGGTKSVTDPIWSSKVHHLERSITKLNKPVVYYWCDGPREDSLVVLPNTQLRPEQVPP